MKLPVNDFKRLCASVQQQLGNWCSMPGPLVVEILSSAGFDWVLLDTEHSLTDIPDLLAMLQAQAGYPGSAVVRIAGQDAVLMKRVLDMGAQTVMVPYVQTADEAAAMVAAMRYAPRGIRGVGVRMNSKRNGPIRNHGLHFFPGQAFVGSIVHALGASSGFLLAIVLMAGIRERIEISPNMPRCLRGLPIALVTAGLMSIAFMGFSGLIK